MNIFKVLIVILFLALAGGFGYFAFVDMPIQQTETVKEIPAERFSAP